ncbi:FMN-binding negative transcriptional regulator [Chondromyces crocatus]|uniref:FMN-binding negative transcriptional regulator n=1 Tax=Chondromyces crocatus TaxID=52 RepID=UPI0007C84FF6|nr:FMN-binding negative transcriptional regulator [Chondromyces crocatus]
MYTPSLFREVDQARLFEVIEANSFGTLVAQTQAGGLEISHLPFLLDREVGTRGRLRFHVARANPIWRAALDGGQVVSVFQGPHAYVSPRWYERPHEQVPTWNYAVVHVHGRVEGPLEPMEVRQLLDDMVVHYESEAGEPPGELRELRGAREPRFGGWGKGNGAGEGAPWRMADLDPGFVESLVGGIVGLSIHIDHLEGKFKLSQNRAPTDRRRVMEALSARGEPADLEVLRLMEAPASEH